MSDEQAPHTRSDQSRVRQLAWQKVMSQPEAVHVPVLPDAVARVIGQRRFAELQRERRSSRPSADWSPAELAVWRARLASIELLMPPFTSLRDQPEGW